ncbi:MAG: HAD family hydrolase [Actinomycetota bacterium]|jgi:2-haloalkanoic acid dehalogenase type II|nr:HAD family hydrolase [Actinomycetota bacterium]MEE3252214.1 HAD family hydrolase [Actinomycetota bacterium]
MARRLTDHSVLTFDCYGTLIDWETGIWDALQPLLAANPTADPARRHVLDAFDRFEAAQQAATPTLPYPGVLECVHRSLAEDFSLATSAELDAAFGASVPSWPAFPDSADSLLYLATRFDLVILSNVDRAGFAASNARLGVDFDAIYTAEDIGSYKPNPANFEYLLEHLATDLGHSKADVLHTAQSIRHDHVPARRIGLDNAWIDRQRRSEAGESVHQDGLPAFEHVFFSMAQMVTAVEDESHTD